ncbi:MAG: winged helix-turn-helix domain-containing protein [Alphaproteobacteria bacterium]
MGVFAFCLKMFWNVLKTRLWLDRFTQEGGFMSVSGTLRFGPFVLRPTQRDLLFNGEPVEVGSRALAVLFALVRRHGQLASKDELLAEVWPEVVVEENNLHAQISALRKVLARDPAGTKYVQTIPGRGYRFIASVERLSSPSVEVSDSFSAEGTPPSLPNGPSIAVLAFEDLSPDLSREYLADGIVEDIITALSHFHWLFVIARSSSFTYKGRTVDVRQIGRELGVRYVLEGSVRSTPDHVRIVAQLIDATTGTHISAERFDSDLKDIFDVQEKLAARVAGAIAPRVEQNEMARVRRRPTENLDAYGHFLQASAHVYQWTKNDNEEALRLLYRAIDLDPDFASAYALAAHCYCFRKSYGPWGADREQAIAETARLVRRAVELGKEDAFALSSAGYSLAYVVRELDDGVAFIDRALALNPNLARAWNYSGWVRIWLGEPEIAVEHLKRAMRLSPLDPAFHAMQAAMASAHFFAGRYDEAASWAEKALREQPNNLDVIGSLALSLALAGKVDEARLTMTDLIRLSPERRLSNINDRLSPYRRTEDRAKVVQAARIAGLPE